MSTYRQPALALAVCAAILLACACSKQVRPQAPKKPAGPGYLGIVYQTLPHGIRVRRVLPGSPAQRAGLQPGDLITQAANRSVVGWPSNGLRSLVLTMRGGEELPLQVNRYGRKLKLTATLGSQRELPRRNRRRPRRY